MKLTHDYAVNRLIFEVNKLDKIVINFNDLTFQPTVLNHLGFSQNISKML